jgi:hypothetical protein
VEEEVAVRTGGSFPYGVLLLSETTADNSGSKGVGGPARSVSEVCNT